MDKKNNDLSHIYNANELNNSSFSREKKPIISEEEKIKLEKERKRLEKLIAERIEKINNSVETSNLNVKNNLENSNVVFEEKQFSDKEILKNERQRQKELKKQRKLEEKERIKREKLIKKNQLLEEKKRILENKKEEKNRKKTEKEILNIKSQPKKDDKEKEVKANQKNERQRQKELEKQKKLEEKERIREEKNKKLKEKYEEQARKKREQEEKTIQKINEKKEKEKKLRKEKEDSLKDRKEKALLIKKAKEESRLKEKKERKTFKEKINDWYNNLSIVKDSKNRKELQRQTLLLDFEGDDAIRSEEKITYKYVAKNKETGKLEKGIFAAFSKLDVHSFLLAEGYEVYEITPQKNISKSISLSSPKFKATQLDFFLTQLSTFLRSGITLVESVKILSKQSNKSAHKNIYKSIIYELSMGENFSEALAKQGNVFPRLLINMIKTSELTGDLPETLDDMADYYRETEKTKKQMISALTYPAVVLTFAVVILIFIMVSVIPQFVSIYNNMESGLPAITVIVIKISNFLKSYWPLVVLGIVAFIIIFIILFKTIKVFRSVVQSIVMNMPVIGKIIIYNEVTMFTKTFASLLNHNVYITDCMEVLSKITGNEVYKMLIFDTITNLARGDAISNSFKNHWAFPTIAYEMILTGEKTGQLGNMMDKVAVYYQEQHKNAVNQIKAFIEPIMIVALAAIVGVVLLSVILPMFDMYQNIGV